MNITSPRPEKPGPYTDMTQTIVVHVMGTLKKNPKNMIYIKEKQMFNSLKSLQEVLHLLPNKCIL